MAGYGKRDYQQWMREPYRGGISSGASDDDVQKSFYDMGAEEIAASPRSRAIYDERNEGALRLMSAAARNLAGHGYDGYPDPYGGGEQQQLFADRIRNRMLSSF